MNDTQLLCDYVSNGSEDAFRELVDRHVNLVYGAALRRLDGDAHGAADVAQAVFEILARKAATLTSHPTLAGWLFSTTHFKAAKTRRSQQRRRMREQESLLVNEVMSDQEMEARWARLRPLLEDAILELDLPDREAVLLRYFEGRAFAEIGMHLRLTEDAARKRVERALEKLERLLTRHGITSTAGALALCLSSQPIVAAPLGLAATISGQALVGAALTSKGIGIGTYMITSKTGLGIAAAMLLPLGAAFYAASDARSTRRELARVTEGRQVLAGELRRSAEEEKARARAEAAETALQTARATAVVPPAGTTTTVSAASNSSAAPGPRPTDQLNANPDYQLAQSNLHRANLRMDFGPLYQRLGLSPEAIVQLEDALVQQGVLMMEARVAAVAQGVSPSDPALTALGKPIIAETNQKIRQLLGPDGVQAYQDHTRVIRARAAIVDPLAGSLYYTNAPLTATQADQLVRVIGASTTNYGMSGLTSTGNETEWSKVFSEAQSFLLPAQIEKLHALRNRATAVKELQEVGAKVQANPPSQPLLNRVKVSGSDGP